MHYLKKISKDQGIVPPVLLAAAFALFANTFGAEWSCDDYPMIVGRKGWLYESLFARIKSLGLERDVIFTGFIDDEEIPCIYDGAAVSSSDAPPSSWRTANHVYY